jgi:hypothetical protein
MAVMMNVAPMYALPIDTTDNRLDGSDKWDQDEYALSVTNHMRFELDSVPVKVDNCCTQTYMEDFIPGTVKPVMNKQVRGFRKTTNKITHQGTIRWSMYDDIGKQHDIKITNSYYVPRCFIRLLSPQHWSQELNVNDPQPGGIYCTTYSDRVKLHWNQH